MAHHAFVLEGDRISGIAAARAHAHTELSIVGDNHPDFILLEYGLFSVDDAREVARFASTAPSAGEAKMITLAVTRVFHEAQNALLKVFEEPPEGVTLALIVPSLGQLLPTLRSRVLVLSSPDTGEGGGEHFLSLDTAGREKFLSSLLERTKSDKDEVKQAARGSFLALVEDLSRQLYQKRIEGDTSEFLAETLADIDAFLPILHERSAPLKLIAEHLILVLPKGTQD